MERGQADSAIANRSGSGQPIRQVAHPVKFSVSEHAPTGGAPELGADTVDVLGTLGLSAAEVAHLTGGS